jgi:hypothetical protein
MVFSDQVRVNGGNDPTGGRLGQLLQKWTGNAGLADEQDPAPAQVGDLGCDRLGGGAQEALPSFPYAGLLCLPLRAPGSWRFRFYSGSVLDMLAFVAGSVGVSWVGLDMRVRVVAVAR